MDSNASLKRYVPTVANWLDRRAQARKKQMPQHLRPRPIWPVWIQIVLNIGIAYTLCHLSFYRDEYFTETGPAFIMGICTFLLIFTIIEGIRYRTLYRGTPRYRLVKINLWLLAIAFLCLPLAIATFTN
jgi:hypothetical protein